MVDHSPFMHKEIDKVDLDSHFPIITKVGLIFSPLSLQDIKWFGVYVAFNNLSVISQLHTFTGHAPQAVFALFGLILYVPINSLGNFT